MRRAYRWALVMPVLAVLVLVGSAGCGSTQPGPLATCSTPSIVGDGGCLTPGDTPLDGVGAPLALMNGSASSTVDVQLSWDSPSLYQHTTGLGFLFLDAADAGTCDGLWSGALGLGDAARFNVFGFPLIGGMGYAPSEGPEVLVVYAFDELPADMCFSNADCPLPDAGGCTPVGAGVGICSATTPTLPSAEGCAVVNVAAAGTTTAVITMSSRP